MAESQGRKSPPISVREGWTVQEFYTHGMKKRFRAVHQSGDKGPIRKSYNSAAADTQ